MHDPLGSKGRSPALQLCHSQHSPSQDQAGSTPQCRRPSQLSHSAGLSKMLGCLLQLVCAFTHSLFWDLFRVSDSVTWSKFQFLSMTPSVLELHAAAHPPVVLPVSPSTKLQLPSMTPSCLQNQYQRGDCYTLPGLTAAMWYILVPLWTIASVCWPWENSCQKKNLCQWCWPLISSKSQP